MQQCIAMPQLMQQQHFALYLANDGELSTAPLIQALWQAGKRVYLPLLDPDHPGQLVFMPYHAGTKLLPNRFGIGEPALNPSQLAPLNQLQVIFTPLVAFDHHGNRLGMGGGFYDRTLAQLPKDHHCQLMGLAHDCQQVAHIPVQSWDQPLQAVITPSRYLPFKQLSSLN